MESFISKLNIFKQNFVNSTNFPSLPDVRDDEVLLYGYHISCLQDDMRNRFKDLLEIEISNWMTDPFATPIEEVEELAVLQSHAEAKALYNRLGYSLFWINSVTAEKCPLI